APAGGVWVVAVSAEFCGGAAEHAAAIEPGTRGDANIDLDRTGRNRDLDGGAGGDLSDRAAHRADVEPDGAGVLSASVAQAFCGREIQPGRRYATKSHFCRKTIRPFSRSYGESCTLTRSPGRMRMKCLRILPETM